MICDMLPHDRESYRQQMGHVWLGFDEDTLKRLLVQAGFEGIRIASLPTDADAKGPALFVAGATRGKKLEEEARAGSWKLEAVKEQHENAEVNRLVNLESSKAAN